MFLAVTRVKDADGKPTNEIGKIFVEGDANDVAKNLNAGAEVEYYVVSLTALNASLKKCAIKTGVRVSAPDREIVEVEADGKVVGSTEIAV